MGKVIENKDQVAPEDLSKAIEDFIEEIFEEDATKGSEDVAKAKKSEDDEECEKTKDSGDDEKEEEKDEDEEEEESEEEEKSMHAKNKFYKKGYEAGMKAAKSNKSETNGGKSMATKSIEASNEVSQSAGEGDDLTSLVKSLASSVKVLAEKVETLSKAPAQLRKSVRGVDFLRKGGTDGKEVDVDTQGSEDSLGGIDLAKSKGRVADLMFEEGLCKGKLSARAIAEYEATGTLSNPAERNIVKSLVQGSIQAGTFQ